MKNPDQEILMMRLIKKTSQSGKVYFTGKLGFNTVYANEYNGKLYIKLQQWPQDDQSDPNNEEPDF